MIKLSPLLSLVSITINIILPAIIHVKQFLYFFSHIYALFNLIPFPQVYRTQERLSFRIPAEVIQKEIDDPFHRIGK